LLRLLLSKTLKLKNSRGSYKCLHHAQIHCIVALLCRDSDELCVSGWNIEDAENRQIEFVFSSFVAILSSTLEDESKLLSQGELSETELRNHSRASWTIGEHELRGRGESFVDSILHRGFAHSLESTLATCEQGKRQAGCNQHFCEELVDI